MRNAIGPDTELACHHPFMPIPEPVLQRAVEIIKAADGLVITAGAGMGVDSGLPDFRGNEGFWKAYPALQAAGLSFVDAANPFTFVEQPRMAWGFYGHRLKLYRETQPHEGFAILRKWGEKAPEGSFVFTSNVDGQFQKAGFHPDRIAECHGSIHRMQCLAGCSRDTWSADPFRPEVDRPTCTLQNHLPRCPNCGGLSRPNILMFGDGDWLGNRYERKEAELRHWMMGLESPVVIEMGAGVAIPTVRWFGDNAPGSLIRINVRDHRVNRGKDLSVAAGALEALEAIDARI
jgi:NAD-dependent SIR2 family protein deacetylase